jgi:hypothetical protein
MELIYDNLTTLIIDLIKHIQINGDFIKVNNNPKKLRFVWECNKTNTSWSINLTFVRSFGQDPKDPIAPLIKDIISQHYRLYNSEIWQNIIIRDTNFISKVLKFNKIKAFW